MSDNLKITCPCCETMLVVDPDSGAILREDRVVKRQHETLDDALGHVKAQHKEAEDKLMRAMEENRNREAILEKKFQEARKKASESDDPPPSPFDGD